MFFKIANTGENHFGVYLSSIILVIIAVLLGNLPLAAALLLKGNIEMTDPGQLFSMGLGSNLTLALVVVPFAFGLFALLFCVVRLHKRSTNSVLTSRTKLDWNRIFMAFGLWIFFNACFELFNYFMSPGDYTFRPPGLSFLILLLVAFLFLPLQIAFEEVLFRGYLLQGLGLATKSRMLALILTSAMFGGLHLANPEVIEYGLGKMMTYYIGTGVVLGIMVIMDDGLELALGVHAGTNIYSAVFVSYEAGALQTDALFHSTADVVDSSIYSFLIFAVIFIFLLSRIYKWKDWGKIWRPINYSKNTELHV